MIHQILSSDDAAITLCRNDLLELEEMLEDWASMIFVSYRSPSYDLEKVKSFENALKRCKVRHTGLLFKNYKFEDLVKKSLAIISRHKSSNPGETMYEPYMVGMELLKLWKVDVLHGSLESTNMSDLKKFFDGRQLVRAYLYCCACTNKYWQKVQGFLCRGRNTPEN